MTDEKEGKLLARLDERTQQLLIDVEHINHKLDNKYVTQDQFKPVQILVYGMAGLMLTGVVGALLGLVFK